MTAAPTSILLHASAAAFGDFGILVQGPSGSGKSALVLALIARGAVLVADDRTRLEAGPGGVMLEAPDTIAGMIEARGVGLLRLPHRRACLRVVVDLDLEPRGRLPPAARITLAGREFELIPGRGLANLGDILSARAGGMRAT